MLTTISFTFAAIFIAVLWKRQRPMIFAGFFVLFGLAYRIFDITYLDLAGPVYAIELERYVGGNEAAPLFIFCSFAILFPMSLMLRRSRLVRDVPSRQLQTPYHDLVQNLALAGTGAIILFLYVDMFRIGTIPLLSGIDRLEYEKMAGVLHGPAYEMNFLISAVMGTFAVLPRLFGKRYSFGFIGLMIALLFYWALTGNRFSPFFTTLSFFFIPYAVIVALESEGTIRRDAIDNVWSVLVSSRVLLIIGGLVAGISIVGLLFNSYYGVRNYADPLFQLKQRTLVQPVQIWASSWDMVRLGFAEGINWEAVNEVLLNPPRPGSNTTIYYLMEREVGYFRAEELIQAGQQYAGGYPEIFFLLFGKWLSIPLMIFFGFTTSLMLYFALRSLAFAKPLTSIISIYIFYGFSLCYIGGMLNFIIAFTFLIKFSFLWLAWVFENYFLRRGGASAHASSADPPLRAAQSQTYRA